MTWAKSDENKNSESIFRYAGFAAVNDSPIDIINERRVSITGSISTGNSTDGLIPVFHGKMKIEDEFKEHSQTIKIISDFIGIDVDYGLVSTYRAINLLKFSTNNLKNDGKKDATKQLLSKMKKSKTFFSTDKILFKTFLNKLKNSKKDADDILYSEIIKKCFKQS